MPHERIQRSIDSNLRYTVNTINVHDYHEAYNHGRLSRKEKVYWCPVSLEKATHRSLPIVSS